MPIPVLIHGVCIDDCDLEVINAGQGVQDQIISPHTPVQELPQIILEGDGVCTYITSFHPIFGFQGHSFQLLDHEPVVAHPGNHKPPEVPAGEVW